MASQFVHLHVHSEYSLLDGACRIPALVARAQELGMPAVAVTDHGTLGGAVQFYTAATKAGIKPILGIELYVATDRRARGGVKERFAHLTLLARDLEGYRNLVKLSTRAFLEGYYYKPRADWELLGEHCAGLICLTGCMSGRASLLLREGNAEAAEAEVGRLAELFGAENVYVELQDAGLPEQRDLIPLQVALAQRLGLKTVATNDVHYLRHEDAYAHDALLCIQTQSNLGDEDRMRYGSDEFYLKSADEMRERFAEYPEACDATLEIAERCDVTLEFGGSLLPHYPVPDGGDRGDVPAPALRRGHRATGTAPSPAPRSASGSTTSSASSARWASTPTSSSSGTSSSSPRTAASPSARVAARPPGRIVSYALGITDIDPLKYDLLFERFLNPGRKSMPDVDTDFSVERRDEVIRYVAEKYGRDHVAQIITFGTMAARAATRDAARVMGLPYAVGDKHRQDDPRAGAAGDLRAGHAPGRRAAPGLRERRAGQGGRRPGR